MLALHLATTTLASGQGSQALALNSRLRRSGEGSSWLTRLCVSVGGFWESPLLLATARGRLQGLWSDSGMDVAVA